MAPPVERLSENLEVPALDNRKYRVIRLSNKLEALLVHDPDTDKASAAVNVNVGSFSDADNMPGLAHAVEHALFMGTEKVCLIDKEAQSMPSCSLPISVPGRKRLQSLSYSSFWIFKCLHRAHRNKLLF